MYKVGDKVVYPHHGAGTVVKREKREVLGEKREYLTIKILHNDMTVNVPADNAERVGLRKVIENDEIKKVVKYLTSGGTEMPKNWNRRFKHNRDKMKTGDIFELAEVVCNLALRDADKGLSTGEKQMYVKAKKILASELMYAKHMSEEDAAEWLDGVLAGVEEQSAATKTATEPKAAPKAATAKTAAAKPAAKRVAAKPVAKAVARPTARKTVAVKTVTPKPAPRKAVAAKTVAARSASKSMAKKTAAKPAVKKTATKTAAKKTVAAKSSAAKKTATAKRPATKKKKTVAAR